MKTIIYGMLAVTGLLFCSCEKGLEPYSGTDYIRFTAESAKDSVDYCFGLAGKTDKDVIGIEVKITGEVCDYDRDFTVQVNPRSTAREGVHFKIDSDKHCIGANRITDTLWLEVVNTPELKNECLYLQLDLVEDQHFRLCFPESNSCKVYLTDKVVKPEWWDDWHETDGLGTYSEKKYQLFIQVSGVADLGETMAFPEKRAAILRFKYYLAEEAAKGRTVADENGQPMRVAMVG